MFLYFYFTCMNFYYLWAMEKEKKKVLSIQTDQTTIDKLKVIAVNTKRSQAKTIEVLIDDAFTKYSKSKPVKQ